MSDNIGWTLTVEKVPSDRVVQDWVRMRDTVQGGRESAQACEVYYLKANTDSGRFVSCL